MEIHPTPTMPRFHKETLLGQKGTVLWFYGLSGSGKSTIANALERVLHDQGHFVMRLDGDNLRAGLNHDLGFDDNSRLENLRRAGEIAKLLAENGVIVLASFITPRGEFRDILRGIIGEDYHGVYVKASYETCASRDVKGLYDRAESGKIKNFTGLTSNFEEPQQADLILDTENFAIEDCALQALDYLSKLGVTGRNK